MTLIITVNTPELSLMLGDARLTTFDVNTGLQYHDCCQKVCRLSHSTLFGFAGSVFAAADFINTLSGLHALLGEEAYNRTVSIQELILKYTLRQAGISEAFRLPDGTLPEIDFVFAGRARPSVPIFQILHFRLPDGHVELLTQHGINVVGSGKLFFQPIAEALAQNLEDLRKEAAGQRDPVHFLASLIEIFISSRLIDRATGPSKEGKQLPPSIGLILHGMYVDQDRITPVQSSMTVPADYLGFPIEARPFGGGYDVSYSEGRFRIRTAANQEVVLMSPHEFIAGRHLPKTERLEPK